MRTILAANGCVADSVNSGRLAEILRHQAALLEHIVTDQRYYPDYFRVAFYGDFPAAIRNNQFIVGLIDTTPYSRLNRGHSTEGSSGKSLGLSANACSTSTQAHSSSEL